MSLVGCPIPGATGFQSLSGSGSLGVLILGEAMGKEEAEQGRGFVEWAQAGSILERAIRRLGLSRDQFLIWNVVPTRPPNNWLEGAPWELEAIEWGRPFLEDIINRLHPRCILALGGVATRVTTGLSGYKMGVSNLTGFVLPSRYGIPVIPCFHPAYLRRGKMSHMSVLLRALRLATVVAREGRQPITPPVDNPPPGYVMFPTEEMALVFEQESRQATYIAFDIETAYSVNEDEAEEEEEGAVLSVQFSLRPESGIFMPWRTPFVDIAKRILSSAIPKLSWNGYRFDVPRLAKEGVVVGGEHHDLMWAHHHAQPDLPRGLQFAAAQMGWPWPYKHLSNSNPQFYGITDAAILQWMVA